MGQIVSFGFLEIILSVLNGTTFLIYFHKLIDTPGATRVRLDDARGNWVNWSIGDTWESILESKGYTTPAAGGSTPLTTGLEQDVTRWIQGLPIWSRPLEVGQLAGLETGGPVVAEVRGVPSVVRLRKVPLGVAPSAEVSRGRVVLAQSGVLPDQVLAGLEQRFGAVQMLPRSLDVAEAISLAAQLRELDSAGPKALLIVDSAGAERLKAGLERIDPDWKIPAVILEIPAGLLAATDPDAMLAYLLNLLARADSLPGRQSAGLEATFTLQAERQVLFISTGT